MRIEGLSYNPFAKQVHVGEYTFQLRSSRESCP